MRSEHVRVFQTLPHSCGYYAERTAQNLVIDPSAPDLRQLYGPALERGFRRAGGHLYLPHCAHCHACTPCRVDVAGFGPDRAQKRCLRRNTDLSVSARAPGYTEERHRLYATYLRARHAGGGMDEAEPSDFDRFLNASWSPTLFLEFRLQTRLVGVAVTDACADSLSAVYTFFDPELGTRSLGTFAILQQVQLARRHRLRWLYLGFWIDGHPKMNYKRHFQPLQIRTAEGWQVMPSARTSTS